MTNRRKKSVIHITGKNLPEAYRALKKKKKSPKTQQKMGKGCETDS